jgi:hypothetical protein
MNMFGYRRFAEQLNTLAALIRMVHTDFYGAAAVRKDLAVMRQRAEDAEKRAELAQNNFEWARVSLNRIEQERSLLLSNLLKFPVPAVAIERQTPFEQAMQDRRAFEESIFDDLGDQEAIRQGLTHDVDGRVIDRRQDG